MKKMTALLTILVAIAVCVPHAEAAKRRKKGKQPVQAPLTQAGQKLQAGYTAQLNALKADIQKALPKISPQKKSAYLKALEAEKAALAALAAAQKNMGQIKSAQGAVGHAKGKWIGGADKGIAQAKAELKNAKTQAERDAAQEKLVKWQKNRQDGVNALKERQAKLDAALRNKEKWEKQLAAAKSNLETAKANVIKAAKALDLDSFLASDRLDGKLAKYQIIAGATPRGLAEFAEKGRTNEALINKLFADDDLMTQMAVAGGAKQGKYGKAMQIYTDIQKASSKSQSGCLQKLALALSIEHAVPISQRSAKAATNAPATVNPVNRYMHYEKAYLNNELDPAFKYLSVWDYRMVVNGEEPDEILTWGRKMLANYRPDQISKKDYRWRYVEAVRSDIKYGSQHNKYDQDDLQFFQNILKNGGVCGRRAFYGRFILRAFGIPTAARPQPGHATLVHWTPDGWVICLGAGWGHGSVRGPEVTGRGRGQADTIFLAQTQARMTGKPYKEIWRAQAVNTVVGQENSALWSTIATNQQRAIIEKAGSKTLAAVGSDIAEANETREKVDIIKAKITAADKKITIAPDGSITVPAVATSKPTKSTGKLIFMPSNLGGKQLHCSRTGGGDGIFEYTLNAPKTGMYALTARVVTPSWKQHLTLKVNGGEAVDIALPYTVGMWDKTQPVKVMLNSGRNVLTFSRKSDDFFRGITIKDFTLKPVR